MEIRELKTMEVGQLVKMAGDLKLSGAGKMPKRELLFRVIQAQATNGSCVAEGVLDRRPGDELATLGLLATRFRVGSLQQRRGELDAALQQARKDHESGKTVVESVEDHVKRVTQ